MRGLFITFEGNDGSGKSSAIKSAGQIIVWNLTISFPTKCKSAGQYFLNKLSSSLI